MATLISEPTTVTLYVGTRRRGSARHRPVVISNSMVCQGQMMISPSRTQVGFHADSARDSIVPLTDPLQSGPF